MKKMQRVVVALVIVMLMNCEAGMIFRVLPSVRAQEHSQKSKKPLVAVLDLQVTGGVLRSEALALSERLRSEMQELNRFDLIERSQIDALLKEQDFSMSEFSEATAAKAGKLISAEQVVIGTIGKVGRTYTIDVRLIDVVTGKVVKSSQQDYDGPTEGLTQVVRNVARAFADLPPLKIKLASHAVWWVFGGAMVAGGGAVVYFLTKKNEGVASFANPPILP